VHGWRKIASASWGPPCDSQIYGDLEFDAGPLLSYLGQVRHASGPVSGSGVAHC